MEYWKIFDIGDPIVNVDKSTLKAIYLAKSRELHPDNNQTDELQFAALNQAYLVLSDPKKRWEYFLKTAGLDITQSSLSQEFLMEMMDINEYIDDPNTQSKAEEILIKLHTELESAFLPLSLVPLSKLIQEDKDMLVQLYLKMNYLDRLKQRL